MLNYWILIKVVEMRGIEPLCKTFFKVLSTCLVHLWIHAPIEMNKWQLHYPIRFVYWARRFNKYNLLKLGRVRTVSEFKVGSHLFLGSERKILVSGYYNLGFFTWATKTCLYFNPCRDESRTSPAHISYIKRC